MPRIIKPQPGFQTDFLKAKQTLVVAGGSASSGKSFALLLESLRHVNNPDHKAIIFRRTSPMLRSLGSIYSESKSLFPQIGGFLNDSRMTYKFNSGSMIAFNHLQDKSQHMAHQGAQYSMIGIDEGTHFLSEQITYLLSRLRNPSINPYCRITCNPDSGSYLKQWIEPFLDSSGQFPDIDKCGKTMYIGFGGEDNKPIFSYEKTELSPLSFTFIPGKLEDNQILLQADPTYRDKLNSLSYVERARLLHGDWSIGNTGGNVFNKEWFKVTDIKVPGSLWALGLDLAATKKGDYSSATLVQKNGTNYFIHKNWNIKEDPGGVNKWLTNVINESLIITRNQGGVLNTYVEQEPGSQSIHFMDTMKRNLPPCNLKPVRSITNKVNRARNASIASEQGRVYYYYGDWNEFFLKQLHGFPESVNDDAVDSFTLAFNELDKIKPF